MGRGGGSRLQGCCWLPVSGLAELRLMLLGLKSKAFWRLEKVIEVGGSKVLSDKRYMKALGGLGESVVPPACYSCNLCTMVHCR